MTVWSEIQEQPATLARLLRESRTEVGDIARWIRRHDVTSVLVAARGTSDNAARYAQYLWGAHNRLSVGLAAPSLFGAYRSPPWLPGSLVVGISQSGRSPDLVGVVEEGRRQRRPTLVITNDPGSPLARAGEAVLDLRAGEERAIAATKTYTAELLAVAMLSAALSDDARMSSSLRAVPDRVAEALGSAPAIEGEASKFASADHCIVLGRGYNHATAFEWALKLQELASLPALPFSTADFQHGPIALAGPKMPTFAVAADGPLLPDIHDLLVRLRDDRRSDLLVMSGRDETLALGTGRIALPARVPEWMSPIVAIVPAQTFGWFLTVARGLDPDSPRGITKVTRTA